MARGDKTIYMNLDNIRIVEVWQNSWEEENLLLLTTLTNDQIKEVLLPLLEEERACENGEVIYANDDMASKLLEAYPNEMVHLYSEPDYLQI